MGALVYLTPLQLEALASSIVEQRLVFSKGTDGVKCKAARGNSIAGILGAASDWADIAIFGRMVANDHTLTLEGAGLFSHAPSTHRVSTENRLLHGGRRTSTSTGALRWTIQASSGSGRIGPFYASPWPR